MEDKSGKDPRQAEHDALANAAPRMTALSDHPITPERGWIDRFNFPFQLGAVYDIIRHPDTKTPMTIAIYGDWGTGKTSAMKWLEGLLKTWNLGEGAEKTRVIPIWFYPWKYQTREDVWRGIISEVLLGTLSLRDASPERVLFAVKRFGAFLGKSFVRALSAVKLKVKDPTGQIIEGETTLQPVEKILEDFQELVHPERAYLNQFESTLGAWIKDSLGRGERLLILIDDLDRCLPDVTLEVLEALKLYLQIEGLVFVVGLDKAVVEAIVLNHYEKRGVGEEKGKDYLAKMFQIEVDLFRMQRTVEEFIDDQLSMFDIWQNEIDDTAKTVFRTFFVRHAGNSPREAKRAINGAMIAARGWTSFSMGEGEKPLKFGEGLQRHFVRVHLRELGTEWVLASDSGNTFLQAWSSVVSSLGEQDIPRNISTDELPEQYSELANIFPEFEKLLIDESLGELLRIYPFRTSEALVVQEEKTGAAPGKHVLLAHSSLDDEEIAMLRRDLQAAGEQVWTPDSLQPGQDFERVTVDAVENSYAVIVCPFEKAPKVRFTPFSSEVVGLALRLMTGGRKLRLISVRPTEGDVKSESLRADEKLLYGALRPVELFPASERGARVAQLIADLKKAPLHP